MNDIFLQLLGTAFLGMMVYILNGIHDEIKTLSKLLNEHITNYSIHYTDFKTRDIAK